MDEYMEKALDIVKAQAAVRPMTEEEILAQIRRLSSLLRGMKQKEETPPVPIRPPGIIVRLKRQIRRLFHHD